MSADPEYKIGLPRQLYVGASRRDVVPIGKRGADKKERSAERV